MSSPGCTEESPRSTKAETAECIRVGAPAPRPEDIQDAPDYGVTDGVQGPMTVAEAISAVRNAAMTRRLSRSVEFGAEWHSRSNTHCQC